jgi:hypothetical protein
MKAENVLIKKKPTANDIHKELNSEIIDSFIDL